MNSDMLAQMRCAYLLHRLANNDPRVAFLEAPKLLLENNAALSNVSLGFGWARSQRVALRTWRSWTTSPPPS
jgi:cytosine/adenosine deaminase-related metal-dependent hydrolase